MSKKYLMGACSLFTLCLTYNALADENKMPNDHAPLGVMGDHTHHKGEWMVGYKYDYTHASKLQQGRHQIAESSVMNTYGDASLNMDMEMHMLEIMYGVSEDLTLMVMPQYMTMEMLHASNHGGGHSHTHEVEALGDTEVTALYSIMKQKRGNVEHKAHLNVGASLPTGDIDQTFTDHHGTVRPLPYNMQFGTGTIDPIVGATYNGRTGNWSWGAQTLNYIRAGKNDNGYRQGNRYTATAWGSRNLNDVASVSLRLKGDAIEDVSGQDQRLSLTRITGANPDLQARETITASVGLNLLGQNRHGLLKGHRLAVEFGVPVYERFDGPSNNLDYQVTVGWQKAF